MIDVYPVDRRQSSLRRDLNDLVRDPVKGAVSEAKVWANAFKAAALYVFLVHAESIVKSWDIMMVFAILMIAPDLFKKWITIRSEGAVK